MPVPIQQIRRRHHHGAQAPHDGKRPLDAQIAVHRNRHHHHAARGHVPDDRDGRQRARGVQLVAVDQVLVRGNENGQDAEAAQHAGRQRAPQRHVRARGPAHPEERQGHGGGAEDGEPEAELGREGGCFAAAGPRAGQVLPVPLPDQRDDGQAQGQPHDDAEEAQPREALGDAVGVGEDEGVAVQEGEEDDVDDGDVEGEYQDDGLAEEDQEGPVEGAPHFLGEGFFLDLLGPDVPRVAGDGAELLRFVLEQDGRVGLRDGEDDG